MTTRKEDAASIIGEELAEDLDKKSAMVGKSEAVIERVEDQPNGEVEGVQETVQASDPAEVAAPQVESKSLPAAENKMMDDGEMGMYRPFSGATTFEEVDHLRAAQDEQAKVFDAWYTFDSLVSNIMSDPSITDKKSAIAKCMSGMKQRLETKALTTLSMLDGLIEKSQAAETVPVPEPVPAHPLDSLIGDFKASFDSVMKSNAANKLAELQPAFNQLGEGLRDYMTAQAAPQPETQGDGNSEIAELRSMISALSETVSLMNARLASQNGPTAPQPPTPQRRSIPPVQPFTGRSVQEVKPGSISELARRSTGIV